MCAKINKNKNNLVLHDVEHFRLYSKDSFDEEGDVETGSVYQWYRSDDVGGFNRSTITGANDTLYTLTTEDVNKFIDYKRTTVHNIKRISL